MDKLLPREIEVDIFSRLPAETLISSKRVCKTWRGLFSDNYFIDAHLRRQSNAGFGVEDDHSYFHKKRGSSRSSDSEEDAVNKGSSRSSNIEDAANSTSKVVSLFWEVHILKVKTNYSIMVIILMRSRSSHIRNSNQKKMNNHLFTPNSNYSLVDSCNGLICFSTSYFSELFVSKDPVCVCNPITGEELNLPRLMVDYQPIEICFKVGIASGFGYVPLINEYKVVRICYYGTEALEVQVYTLGSGNGWERCKGNIDCLMPSNLLHHRVSMQMELFIG
ncbi:F-box protein At3g07870-like [Papaver somniferum]|uniref:F-box protein At3g07870-like n=1 Tax=Papaver somniferum TaxID=3469 RepID=UPI000E6FE94C|nr:F-box protein At3g07870-like [Papaver somniferum]